MAHRQTYCHITYAAVLVECHLDLLAVHHDGLHQQPKRVIIYAPMQGIITDQGCKLDAMPLQRQ